MRLAVSRRRFVLAIAAVAVAACAPPGSALRPPVLGAAGLTMHVLPPGASHDQRTGAVGVAP